MKAITLTQPWAHLVAIGAKQIETRSWATAYRGPVAIHAGKGPSSFGWPQLNHICNYTEPFRTVLKLEGKHPAEALPIGAVVAVAELVDCVPTKQLVELGELPRHRADGTPQIWVLTEQERTFGDYTPGRYAWLLGDVHKLPEPIPARGALGLWDWTPPAGLEL